MRFAGGAGPDKAQAESDLIGAAISRCIAVATRIEVRLHVAIAVEHRAQQRDPRVICVVGRLEVTRLNILF
jgi:hypothetical protein